MRFWSTTYVFCHNSRVAKLSRWYNLSFQACSHTVIRRTFLRTLPILKGGRFVTTTALRCHVQNWQANSVVRIRTIEGNRSANHRLKWLKFLQCSHVVHAVGKFDDQDANILRCPCKDLAHKEARCIRHKWRAAKAALHCTICIYARIGYT